MAVQRILSYYDEKNRETLKLKSEPVYDILSEETQNTIQDLKDTIVQNPGTVGLSAIQIGVPKQICVIKYDIYFLTIINPVVTRTRGDIVYREGCASCPDTFIQTHRFQKIWADYYDEHGNLKRADQGGLFSVIMQHEMDHFNGVCLVGEAALKKLEEETKEDVENNKDNQN